MPQDIIPESEKKDKIPHNKIKLHSNKRTTFYHNNLFHSSRAHWYKLEFIFQLAPITTKRTLLTLDKAVSDASRNHDPDPASVCVTMAKPNFKSLVGNTKNSYLFVFVYILY